MVATFLNNFFPPDRTAQLLAEITHFAQCNQELLYEAWEWYKGMLKRCSHHSLHGWVVIQTFFGGLHPQFKNDITAADGGTLMNKTFEESWELIENLAKDSYATPRSDVRKVASVHDTDEFRQVKAQIAAINNQLKNTSLQGQTASDGVVDQFSQMDSPEQVNFLQNHNRPRNDPFSNTYNEGWRTHPNFAWSQPPSDTKENIGNTQTAGNNSNFNSSSNPNNIYHHPGHFQRRQEEGENKPRMEEMMMKFMAKMDNTAEGLKSSVSALTNTVRILKAATYQNTTSIQIL
ncbi:hypothetical protein L6452_34913 [Arctium lappa]|uniref:Uncharacterized protein n=1 Tax=Arctium lappa TaxID=4217 RepID=A0ACB8YK36_ARCLA|nr:hypothetical protein L6452_34913 [Arctium lappa]